MSCPWMDNRSTKEAEMTAKFGPLRWELKQQYHGYEVKQFNMIIDVLGGWSVELEETMLRRQTKKISLQKSGIFFFLLLRLLFVKVCTAFNVV